jgi:predicted acylesterase/phospholipase RssA
MKDADELDFSPGAINYAVPPKPPGKPVTALCLSGDGARIPIKAGMLKAYAESGIKHDMVFATSSGALAGALYHQGDLDVLLDLCRTIKNSDVYRLAPWKAFGSDAAFYDSTPLAKLIKKLVNPAKLRANRIPFTANVTEIQEFYRSPVFLESASDQIIQDTLLASASVPVAFPPVRTKNGAVLADGGLTNDYCVEQAVMHGAKRIILMTSLVNESRPIKNWIDALEATISAGIESQLAKELEIAEREDVEVIICKPEQPTGVGILDFSYNHKDELIELGYNLAKTALAKITAEPQTQASTPFTNSVVSVIHKNSTGK